MTIRFWQKVTKTDACWLWTGALNSSGYGCFMLSRPRKQVRAHRWAYEQLVGPVPSGLTLDHLCRNRACVNPAHLEPVTRRENIRRGEAGKYLSDKTHCPSGHPYDEANTYHKCTGGRVCRACNRDYMRRRRAEA